MSDEAALDIGRSCRIARFWAKVDIRSEQECWPWKGFINNQGYARVSWERQNHPAARIAYQISRNIRLGKWQARHTCDNRACVNPNHLVRGTRGQNFNDMVKRGRRVVSKGEGRWSAKLTESDVREIRTIVGHLSNAKIAAMYGVHTSSIAKIKLGQKWKHVV